MASAGPSKNRGDGGAIEALCTLNDDELAEIANGRDNDVAVLRNTIASSGGGNLLYLGPWVQQGDCEIPSPRICWNHSLRRGNNDPRIHPGEFQLFSLWGISSSIQLLRNRRTQRKWVAQDKVQNPAKNAHPTPGQRFSSTSPGASCRTNMKPKSPNHSQQAGLPDTG